jgi:hypothetical protein
MRSRNTSVTVTDVAETGGEAEFADAAHQFCGRDRDLVVAAVLGNLRVDAEAAGFPDGSTPDLRTLPQQLRESVIQHVRPKGGQEAERAPQGVIIAEGQDIERVSAVIVVNLPGVTHLYVPA